MHFCMTAQYTPKSLNAILENPKTNRHEAAKKLVEAANVMAENSAALQLRYLQTMSDMSNKNASTIVFPLPMDIMEAFRHMQASTAQALEVITRWHP